jgi:epoxyqueuosine reductase
MPMESKSKLIKDYALTLGFDDCGFAKAEFLEEDASYYKEFLEKNWHAGLPYLEKNYEKRLNPEFILQKCHSVIITIINYFPTEIQNPGCSYKICKYGYGGDYHRVITDRLEKLAAYIRELSPTGQTYSFVDSGAVLEKTWAIKAGMGWRGKNTLVINRKLGSFFFIGGILTDIEMEYDKPVADLCGDCELCLNTCPTGALVQPRRLDIRNCITFHNGEARDKYPGIPMVDLNGWMYGCDICQDVCPWNKKLTPTSEKEFSTNTVIRDYSDRQWEQMTDEEFLQHFSDSSIKRTGIKVLRRNMGMIGKR